MDKSWVNLDRKTQEYREKLELFLTEAFEKSTRSDKIICPCKKCCNRYYHDKVTVGGHLLWHGMDRLYMNARWTHHGESYVNSTEEEIFDVSPTNGDQLEHNDQGAEGEVYELLNETFVQPMIGETVGSSRQQPIFEDQSPEAENYYKLLKEADMELYPGCQKYKKMDAILKLYQIKCLGHVSNSTFSMFLEAFKDMLPDGDCLPKSYQQAKKSIDGLSLPSEKIDACPNDCMLFWKDTSNLTECLTCGASRYIVTSVKDNSGNIVSTKKTSAKILRYFPLIPRLKRLYMSKHTAEHMRWHATECPKDEFMRHPSDSPAWKHLDFLYADFASEIRNVRLGLASDGFNPFSDMSKPHSTWPVIITVYNLPPWMSMKQPYMYMSLLIPGPKEPGNDIDVYLRPLLDELKELWDVGTPTYDVYSNQTFNMRAALLWTINDFPAYAKLSGWSTSGKFACPKCNHQTCAVRLQNSKKYCYPAARRFLPTRHRWRNDRASFNGNTEHAREPLSLNGTECLREWSTMTFKYGKSPENEPVVGGKRRRSSNAARVPTTKSPWKKKSIFYILPYLGHLLIRHNIDVMHVEKNICEILLATILGLQQKMKDTPESRKLD